VRVEIWSDVVCPWCYIGKRRFEAALALFAHRDDVDVIWRSFQLDPDSPPQSSDTMADHLATKLNVSHDEALSAIARVTSIAHAEGLEYRLDEARTGNTFDAHRLLHLAAKLGRQSELAERFMSAYFTEAAPIGDRETLSRLAVEVGLDAHVVQMALEDNMYADEVTIEQQTARQLGATGVPFFVINRAYAISGAQATDVILDVLQEAWDEEQSAI